MLMLAVSTSAKNPSAALLLPDGTTVLREDKSGKPHSVSLMPLMDDLISENGIELADIDCFAVDVGPGSFTGVRIGVSVVNAMAFALGKPIIAVSSLEALSQLASDEDETVCCLLDARNGNGYAAIFRDGECTLQPCACVQREIIDTLPDGARIIGDCLGGTDACDAELVIAYAQAVFEKQGDSCLKKTAVPMYLRPSQAERMKAVKTPAQASLS